MDGVVILVARASQLAKAQAVNSVAPSFASLDALSMDPTSPAVLAQGITAYSLAAQAEMACDRVYVMPYADAPVGSMFSVRVYGWKVATLAGDAGNPTPMYIPTMRAELLCVTCNRSSPFGYTGSQLMLQTERFCDTITLTQGTLGVQGSINSTGAQAGAQTDLIADAKIDMSGCTYLSFDFQLNDTSNLIGMNCFWCRA